MTKRITFLPILLLFSLWSYGQYCVPNFPLGCTDDHIDNFEIPAINFAHLGTGCSSGQYADYSGDPSLLIVLEAGKTYDWSTTSNYAYQHVKIWVDINGDQVFDEATEEIDYAQSGSVLTLTEGEISIPAIFPPGTYRMRIATRYRYGFDSTPPSDFIPCNNEGYGEAHDYTVQILPPNCPTPTALTAGNITDSSIELGWTENGTATAWDIEYGVSPYTPTGTPTVSGVSSNPYTLGGLAPLTAYEVYVRANCGGGDESNWFGPVAFTTLATGQATLSATYTGGDIPTQYNSSSGPFVVDDVCNGASTTLNLQLPAGGPWQVLGVDVEYAMTTVSGGGGWMSEQRSRIYFQNTDIPEVSTESSGVFHGTGSSAGTISYSRTGVDIANGFYAGGENLIFEMHAWRTWESTSYLGCNTDVTKVDNNTWKIDVFYAPVTVCIPPSQVDINNITAQSATVSWSQVGSATSWEMEYVPTGNAPTGSGVSVTSPHVITGLTPLTEYNVYIRSVCGPGDESVWEGPYTFKTAADCSLYTLSVTANDGYVCDEGTTILTATGGGAGDAIYWYDAPSGGNLLGTGNSFETPELTQTTSYWVAEVLNGGPLAGQANANPTTFSNSTSNSGGLLFTVNNPIVIVDVEVFGTSTTGGDITIELRDIDNGNATIASTTATITGGGTAASPIPHTIPLDFVVPAAGNYRLVRTAATASVGMGYVTAANSSFPYPLGNSGEVTGGATATGTSISQYFFFNWTIKEAALCESSRDEAIATVVTVEEVEASAADTQIDPGNSTTLTATSTNTNYTYAWTWDSTTGGGTGTGTGASITVTPTAHTTYTVTATDSVTGCIATDEIEILVFDTTLCSSLAVTVDDGYVCDEGTTILTASGSGSGDDIYWYDAATGGNLVGKGANFETPFLTQTTSYWAAEVLQDIDVPSNALVTYCTPTFTIGCSLSDTIDDFILEDSTNTVLISHLGTGCSPGAYGDYTGDASLQADLEAGETYSFSATHGADRQYLRIWIDFDGNGSFEDAGELVYEATSAASSTFPTVGTFEIPSTISAINTVMRVKTTYSTGVSDSCTQSGSWGEAHDYMVSISSVLNLCESPREEAIATVVDVETVEASATDTKVDPGNSTTLTATSTNSNYTYAWTWDSTTGGGTGTATGASITVTPSAHTTYTVTATDSVTGCVATDEIEILVFNTALCNTLDITTTIGATVCVGASATLTASASGTGDEIYWYDAATGGNLVGKGANFATPELTQTTSYWAAEALEDVAGPLNPIEAVYTSGSLTSLTTPAFITFAIENTNGFPVVLNGIDNYMPANTTRSYELWYHPTNLSGSPGAINTANGWILAVQEQTMTSGSSLDVAPVLENFEFTIPANTTWRFALVATANISGPTNFYYWGSSAVIASPNIFSDNGVNLLVNDHTAGGTGNVGYGGTYNPRGFRGTLHFDSTMTLCESDREEVVATVINAIDPPVGAEYQAFLGSETLADLDVTGTNLTWYADAAGVNMLPDTTPLADGATYYVSQSVNGCESEFLAVTTIKGYVYLDNNWLPSNPSGVSTSSDNIYVIDGLTTINVPLEVKDIHVMNDGTLRIENVLHLHGDLTVDGELIFGSTPSGNGELAAVSATSTITGEVTVEHYMKDRRSYRMVSSAVTTTTSIHDNWQEGATSRSDNPNPGYGTHITGTTIDQTNGFDGTQTGNASMYTVDVATQTFQAIANTDVNTLTAGDAYLMFIRGDRTLSNIDTPDGHTATTLRARGQLVTGNHTQTFPTTVAGQFVMFGNPYQSAVDINDVFANSVNVNTNHYYVYDVNIGDYGNYVTVNLPAGTNPSGSSANQYLQAGQAAQFATLSNGPTALNFMESAKAPGNYTSNNAGANGLMSGDILNIQLYTAKNFSEGGSVHDGMAILFDAQYSNNITATDAPKAFGFGENIARDHNGTYLSIERREMPVAGEVYSLYTAGYNHQEYVFKIDLEGVTDVMLYLDDNYTGTSTLLQAGVNTYSFEVSDALSQASDRFSIRTESLLNVDDPTSFAGVRLYPNPLNAETFYVHAPMLNGKEVEIRIADISGRQIYNRTLQSTSDRIEVSVNDTLSSGVYLVTIKHAGEFKTYRLIRE